jgi:hypothetical protein
MPKSRKNIRTNPPNNLDEPMNTPTVREMVQVMSQLDSPLGSYTGTAADDPDPRPVQDADDL